MSLIACPDCGKEISNKADACLFGGAKAELSSGILEALRRSLIVIAFFVSAPCKATELSVLGIQFDAPFTAVECPNLGVPGGEKSVAASLVETTCIAPRDIGNWQTGYKEVWLPVERLPTGISNPIRVRFEHGTPKTMQIKTSGLASQSQVLKMLETKFGPPTTQSESIKQTPLGAKYSAIEAEWKTPDVEVVMKITGVGSGNVIIIGPDARKATPEHRRSASPASEPKL